ncbi:MAG: HD domain-containing protein [Pseudomonadota bacterium]|jgi:predicted HD phosphohydrolase|nr:HD domain-containing protein [Pseudomonadota bacterium]MEC7786813.1 HD domain-containing protein [Pseudomonadota bacterium]MEC8169393.1 HD domain-containing protein [Pseudomonadota bacterium]MEC8377830.1 HD domain-containing protein [Pseudomonadota bacterium]|tara:strand:- start:353 stop:922 length:570 start_codon:yes stop_codon:yes gene_type:complete
MSKFAKFTEMVNGTAEDYVPIVEASMQHNTDLPKRILEHLEMLKGDHGGFAVDRYTHCLQTATRAYRDGRDDEYVVCALLHDIGDILAPANHADFAATLLEPYISEKNFWILKHHGIFQGYYFFHFLGLDRNMRDNFKDNEHWRDCAEFCAKYDQNSFDPDYDTLPIETFVPMLEKVLSKTKKSIYKAD